MLTMHPTLLIGPYDWDAERLPRSEFLDRIQTFWQRVRDPEITAAIVYGDSRNHAELAYLSNFVPKLGPALMLIAREGEPTLLVSGAPNMLAAAKRLTWVDKTQPLGEAARAVSEWMKGNSGLGELQSPRRVALVGGEYMRSALYRPLIETLGSEESILDASDSLRSLMRHKRPREFAIIREACAILSDATKALAKAKFSGAGVTAVILAAEQAARQAGAQDVRTLFSVDGGKTLRPFESPIDGTIDPLQAYLAVRHAGYWAEGFVMSAASRNPALARAADALRIVVQRTKAGTSCRDLARLAAEEIKPYCFHPVMSGSIGNSIGLVLEDKPRLMTDGEESLDTGGVYTLRVGASNGQDCHAIVSAMVAVNQDGTELLWSAV